MNQPINLNKIRKAVDKVKKRQQANENTVKFGQTKAERILSATLNDKARRTLDSHQFEEDE